MQLQPKNPPRNKGRRVRAFSAEIRRLQAEGYTCEEIRETLADVGVVVSKSTVQRAAAGALLQVTQRVAAIAAGGGPTPRADRPIDREPIPPSHLPGVDGPRSAKQIAEDFMKTQVTNPLLYAERKLP